MRNDVDFACGVENLADRHSIGTNGGYRVHQIPSKPGRGIYFHFPTFLLNVDFLMLTLSDGSEPHILKKNMIIETCQIFKYETTRQIRVKLPIKHASRKKSMRNTFF